MSYVDLHLHLLPGVDDGAADEAESLAYIRRMADEGVREATVTPHVAGHVALDIASIPERVARLQHAVERQGLGVRLHAGGEIHPRRAPRLGEDELGVIAHGPPGRRWLLVEVPFAGIDADFISQCERLGDLGYGVLIAHPERARGLLAGGLALLEPLLASRAALQVNVCSLLGHHGLEVQEAAVSLLRSGRAHVLASDAHPGSREQTLRLGFDLALRAGASSVQAWRLTQDHPRSLLRAGMRPACGAGEWAANVRSLAA